MGILKVEIRGKLANNKIIVMPSKDYSVVPSLDTAIFSPLYRLLTNKHEYFALHHTSEQYVPERFII